MKYPNLTREELEHTIEQLENKIEQLENANHMLNERRTVHKHEWMGLMFWIFGAVSLGAVAHGVAHRMWGVIFCAAALVLGFGMMALATWDK